MPEMLLSASSIGSTTDVAISSGLAPGSCSETLTVAGSALGNRSTPRSRNEKIPSTTSDMTSIVAKTGRRTQSSESINKRCARLKPSRDAVGRAARRTCLFDVAADGHLQAVGELVDVGHGDHIARLHAGDDLDALAHAIAHFQLARGEVL